MNWRVLRVSLAFTVLPLLLMFAAYWGMSDHLRVRVEIDGTVARASINDTVITILPLADAPGRRTGLLLGDEPYPQGWDGWIVRDLASGTVLEADSFSGRGLAWDVTNWRMRRNPLGEAAAEIGHDPSKPTLMMMLSPFQVPDAGVSVEARFKRGQSGGIVLAMSGEGDGYAFLVRPRYGDCYFTRFAKGLNLGPVPGTAMRVTPAAGYSSRNLLWIAAFNILAAGPYLLAIALASFLSLILLTVLAPHTRLSAGFLRERWEDLYPETRTFAKRLVVLFWMLVALMTARTIASVTLEGIPHVQDAIATLFQGRIFARGALTAPAPPEPGAFNFEMLVISGGHWLGKYTIGHPLMLVPWLWLNKPWMLGPSMAFGTVPAVFLFARIAFGLRTAYLAAALLAMSPFFLIMSGSYMAHTSTLFWACWFHALLVAWMRFGGSGLAAGAGLCIGMTAIGRPFTGVLAALPAVPPLLAYGWSRRWRSLAEGSVFLAVAMVPVGAQLAYNWRVLGDPRIFGYQVYSPADRLGFGDVGWLGGHSPAQALHNTLLNLTELLPHLMGWPFWLGLTLALLAPLLPGRTWWDAYLWAQCLALPGGYFFWWYHGIAYGPRFWYEITGCLILLTARGAAQLARWVGGCLGAQWPIEPARTLAPAASAAGSLAVLGLMTAGWSRPYLNEQLDTTYRAYNFTDAALLKAVREKHLRHDVVFVPEGLFWSEFGVGFSQNSPWLDGPVVYAQSTGEEVDRRVMARYPKRRSWIWIGRELRRYDLSGEDAVISDEEDRLPLGRQVEPPAQEERKVP